ncbi:MAG: cobalt transporter permease [Bacillales bacterium]|jgi:energy-coupling factor transport system permease protein|nr:cobalt transporter permease [Bacillales bacterium]
MKDKLIIGQYLPIDSVFHRLDPRTKIVFVFLFVLVIFLADSLLSYGISLIFVAVFIMLSNVPIKYILKGLKPVLFLIILTFLLHIFWTKQGEVLLSFWGLNVYSGGIEQGVFVSLRFLLLVSMTTLLTLTTSPIAITDGIEILLGPLKKVKVPVHEIALMLSISLRFIPTLLEETDKIMKAQISRGVEFTTGPIKSRVKSFVPLLIPLFVSAFKRAEDLAIAMEARGYRGGEGRTKYRLLQMKKTDFSVLGAIVIYTAIMIYLRGL